MLEPLSPELEDTAPPTERASAPTSDLVCEVCSKPLVYAGRGRKPRYCDDHKPKRGAVSSGSANTANARKAGQAADILANANKIVGFGAMALSMTDTASVIAEQNDSFRSMAYDALLMDQKLCNMILSAGGKSGAAALVLAYVMLGASVAPTAVMEIRTLRAEREAE